METKTILKSVIAASLLFLLTACFETKKEEDKTSNNLLVLMNTIPEVSGQWNYFNGKPDYAGQTSPYTIDAGNISQGTYVVDATQFTSTYKTFGATVTNIRMLDNSKNVAFVQNPADAQYGPSKFMHYIWTHDGNFFYICPDLSGYKNTLEEAITSFNNLTTTQVDPSNLNGGCFGTVWSRLEQ
ncbi:hypothetical protein CH373_01280 [Leptospira perolatii]|uniref:Lipocalin-like domain-containing protein n=1 Tax=Leptospira perolatii TaxID=2023191 RepID=A0A2M9ZRW1_9LEPT|nr:hypothetical protein [Leptospira perolatii]PJZ71178.1 hypothetical protein CH360_01280 [Leptospira perolatii]PJZ74711.1 hypothetical protein CH373_01280 [Leptospira perolatii]